MLLRKAGYTGRAYREQYEGKTQTDVPAEAWRYIGSLQLHVYEMRHLPKAVRELFQSDMA